MLKELKSPQKDSAAWCSLSDKLQMAEVSILFIFLELNQYALPGLLGSSQKGSERGG